MDVFVVPDIESGLGDLLNHPVQAYHPPCGRRPLVVDEESIFSGARSTAWHEDGPLQTQETHNGRELDDGSFIEGLVQASSESDEAAT